MTKYEISFDGVVVQLVMENHEVPAIHGCGVDRFCFCVKTMPFWLIKNMRSNIKISDDTIYEQ